jgi:hypothetical protein
MFRSASAHSAQARSSRWLLSLLLLALLALFALAAPAMAQSEVTRIKFEGPSLQVTCEDYEEITGGYSFLNIFALQSTARTQGGQSTDFSIGSLFYSTYDPTTGEFYYAVAAYQEDVSLTSTGEKKLETATMSATFTVTKYCFDADFNFIGTEEGTARVNNLTLTGTGDVTKSTYTDKQSSPGDFKYSVVVRDSERMAAITGGTVEVLGMTIPLDGDCISRLFYSSGGFLEVSHP